MTDDKHVYSSCVGLSDGVYYVQIDLNSSMPVKKAECSNEYIIVNYVLDNNWESYFLSFFQSHAKVASPLKADTAYACRESVYNHGTSKTDISSNNLLYATFVDEWIVTDLNGIDKDILLTQLAGRNECNLGTFLTLKQPSDNERFTTITEREKSDVVNGNDTTIGIKDEYCVCAKKSITTRAEKRKITETEVNTIETMAAQVKEQKASRVGRK